MSPERKQNIPDVTFYPQGNDFVAIAGECAPNIAYSVSPEAIVIDTQGHFSISPSHLAYRALGNVNNIRIANEDPRLTVAEVSKNRFAWLSYRQIVRRSRPPRPNKS